MSDIVDVKQLTKIDNGLSVEQIQEFFTRTPLDKVKTRPAKGGGEWKFVSGSYVTQVLNNLFGFNWSFEVITPMSEALVTAKSGVVVVQGRLKVKIGDDWVTKEQYGRKEIAKKKDGSGLLDFGNDLKAAATDAKKKCASELGLFADVYAQEDFIEAEVVDVAAENKKSRLALARARKSLRSAKTVNELKDAFLKLSPGDREELTPLKDELKATLSENPDEAN